MNRFGAFLIHLGISLVIFAVLAYLVVYVWYPDFFFASDGGWQGIRIIVLVDLVLGPTLTLVVFNRKKPRRELRRDLSMIGIFQAICLVAGTYVVYMEKPLALVYVDGRFASLSADDFRNADVPIPDLDFLPGSYPKRVVVEIPEDPTAQSSIRREAMQRRQPLNTKASLYVPYDYDLLNAQEEALPQEWLDEREAKTGDVSAWLAAHGGELDDYAFFTFGARYGFLVLGVSRESGEVVGLLNTDLSLATKAQEPAPNA
jgi:hypothetical protein